MQLGKVLKAAGKFVRDNDNTICAIAAVIGVGVTVYTTAKATIKIKEDLDKYDDKRLAEEEEDIIVEEKEVKKEKAKIIFKDGWYVVVSATGTIIFMLASHKLSVKKIKEVGTAAAFWRETYTAYKNKVKEHIGKDEEEKIRSEIIKEKAENGEFDPNFIRQVGRGQVLFIDPFGHYIRSSLQELQQEAFDCCNHFFDYNYGYGDGWFAINEWYNWIGDSQIYPEVGDRIGVQRNDPLDIRIIDNEKGPTLPTGETATVLTFGCELVAENTGLTIHQLDN